jgi:hypothetical protein
VNVQDKLGNEKVVGISTNEAELSAAHAFTLAYMETSMSLRELVLAEVTQLCIE